MGKLKALDVSRLPAGMHADGDGLYLQIGSAGARSWIWRYSLSGRERYLGLGSAAAIPLKRARELAAEARRMRAEGVDPIEHRRQQRDAVRVRDAKAMTFGQVAAQYITAHEGSWGNARHREQWRNTLAIYVLTVIGSLPVQAIDTALVLKVLQPVWATIPETANRIRGRIELILDYAVAHGYRASGDNPARWRGHLSMILPKRSKVARVEHHAALPYAELPAFMADLRRRESTSSRALEFLILTAARAGEVRGATWQEIDLDAGLWTISGERMKTGKPHRVPLSDRMLDILRDMSTRRENSFLFPGLRGPLSTMALGAMLKVMRRTDITVHGFRSSFRDWAGDRTAFARDVVEAALAHAIENRVEAAYRRGDALEKRRRLMESWAAYCASTPAVAVVVPLRA
jgi:integrase